MAPLHWRIRSYPACYESCWRRSSRCNPICIPHQVSSARIRGLGSRFGGSVVTAVLFEAGKVAIGLYIHESGVSSGFGVAGTLVVLLLRVYYSTQVFLFGAELTRTKKRQRTKSSLTLPRSISISKPPPEHCGTTQGKGRGRLACPFLIWTV